jgi:hypothetical protein
MITTISWHQYFIFLAVSTILYYLVVYLLYFRTASGVRIQKWGSFNNDLIKKEELPSLFDHPSNVEDNLEDTVYACMDELNAFFENSKKSKAERSEVIVALHSLLQKYPSLKNSEFRQSITNVIATQCENICSIHLSAEELKGVWFG